MVLEEDAQKQCKVLNKVLFVFFAVLVRFTNVGAQREHLYVSVCVCVCECVCVCGGGGGEGGRGNTSVDLCLNLTDFGIIISTS